MKHERTCIGRQEAAQKWRERWSKYCTQCGAAGGGYTSYDPSPSGVSLSSGTMEDYSICPGCVDRIARVEGDVEYAYCPRCGEPNLRIDEELPCPDCSWNWGHGTDDALPDSTCECEYDQMPEQDVPMKPETMSDEELIAEMAAIHQTSDALQEGMTDADIAWVRGVEAEVNRRNLWRQARELAFSTPQTMTR